jgi:hypothetical protein
VSVEYVAYPCSATLLTVSSIIAVHGLNPRNSNDAEHAWNTWCTPTGPDGRLWLRDDLPEYIAESRVFLYEYNATATFGNDTSTFISSASALLEAIQALRGSDNDSSAKSRPILFLGHSIGGLLIKQALINAHNNPDYSSIEHATKGLVFFATPHRGGDTNLASLGGVMAKIAAAMGFQEGDDLLERLKTGRIFSDVTQERWKYHLLRYHIRSFWGTLDNVKLSLLSFYNTDADQMYRLYRGSAQSLVCRTTARELWT